MYAPNGVSMNGGQGLRCTNVGCTQYGGGGGGGGYYGGGGGLYGCGGGGSSYASTGVTVFDNRHGGGTVGHGKVTIEFVASNPIPTMEPTPSPSPEPSFEPTSAAPNHSPSAAPSPEPSSPPTFLPSTFTPTVEPTTPAPTVEHAPLVQHFSYQTGVVAQYFKVPYNVPDQSIVIVQICGAQGGYSTGGLGGRLVVSFPVYPGEELEIVVGQQGTADLNGGMSPATVGGGGVGQAGGGSGGGSSSVTTYGRYAIAGGGGGGIPSSAGGPGGGVNGQAGACLSFDCVSLGQSMNPGGGGGQTAGGSGGWYNCGSGGNCGANAGTKVIYRIAAYYLTPSGYLPTYLSTASYTLLLGTSILS